MNVTNALTKMGDTNIILLLHLSFEAFTAVMFQVEVFWVMMLYSVVVESLMKS
jgi:hypothetical protein